MSRLSFHEKSDARKWAAVTIAILLLAAVIVSGICTDWYTEKNKFCLFGHDYDEAGKCIRCGKDKPIENEDVPKENTEKQDKVEIEAAASEPVMYTFSEASLLAASSGSTASSPFWSELDVGYYLDESETYAVSISELLASDKYNEGQLSTVLLFVGESNTPYYLIYYVYSGTLYYEDSLFSAAQSYSSVEAFLDNVRYQVSVSAATFATFELNNDEVWGLSMEEPGDVTVYIYDLPAAPSKTGYTFTGWYTDEACTHKYDAATVTGDITLYAGFRANNYSIKFNANTGSGTMANEAMTYDQAKNLTSNAFAKQYHTFKGWATSANGSVVYSNGQSVKNLSATDGAVIELFAVWERNAVVITYVVDGKTTTATSSAGAAVSLPANPTKAGHTFVGWYLADGTKYTNQTLSEDTTLTARFEIIRCTVTFMVDGEVYATYVCDWGTSLSEALTANDVNPALLTTEDEYSPNF